MCMQSASNKGMPQGPERRASGPRRHIFVPHPNATGYDAIVDNCLTGLRQSGMDKVPDIAPLLDDPSMVVSSIRRVQSLSDGPDYHLLVFSDRGGRHYAVAAVSDVGWLLEAAKLPEGGGIPDEAELLAVAARHGKTGANSVRWLMIPAGAAGSTDFLSPMAAMDTDEGRTVFVNLRREAFERDANGEIRVNATESPFRLRRLKGEWLCPPGRRP